jgi:shikimate kinase
MQLYFLIGLMGSGKTFLAKKIAAQHRINFLDTDEIIEKEEQKSIAQIFETNGEKYFRTLEQNLLIKICNSPLSQKTIVATGGGMPCFFDNMKLMNNVGTTIWLNISTNELIFRLENTKTIRPLLQNLSNENLFETLQTLLTKRLPFYSASHYTINNPQNAFEIIQEIILKNEKT